MQFKEYSNPLEKDYDINSSLKESSVVDSDKSTKINPYAEILCDEIGILEDIDDESLMEMYGITVNEYLHPTKETILKVRASLEKNKEIGRSR